MFINILISLGGTATNKKMIEQLRCTKEEYAVARDSLIREGVIKKIRCRGGGIAYVKEETFPWD